jgi:hypothetical protein
MGVGIIILLVFAFIIASFFIGWGNLIAITFLLVIAYLFLRFLFHKLWLP